MKESEQGEKGIDVPITTVTGALARKMLASEFVVNRSGICCTRNRRLWLKFRNGMIRGLVDILCSARS